MAATWPSDVPLRFDMSSYAEVHNDGVIQTAFDAGRPKVRRRFSTSITERRVTLVLTESEKDALRAFIRDDLNGGALPFVWLRPTGDGTATETVRMVLPRNGRVQFSARGRRPGEGRTFTFRMAYEVQP